MCELIRSALFVPVWAGCYVGVRLLEWTLTPVYAVNNIDREEINNG